MIFFYYILIFVFLDNVLTHYQKFLMEKKDCYIKEMENNPVIRPILNRFDIGFSIILTAIYQYLFFAGMTYIAFRMLDVDVYLSTVSGMFIVVLFYHLANIKYLKKYWKNQKYWIIRKQLVEAL